MDGYSEFGKRVVCEMVKQDVSHKELAAKLGIKPSYLSRILHGTKPCERYQDDIEYILHMKEIPKPKQTTSKPKITNPSATNKNSNLRIPTSIWNS